MPLTFFIPLGLIVVAAGVTLLFTRKYKTIGIVMTGLGLAVTLFTIGVIVLAVGSM